MNITYEEAQAILRYKEEECDSDEDVALALSGFEKLKLIKSSKEEHKPCEVCGTPTEKSFQTWAHICVDCSH